MQSLIENLNYVLKLSNLFSNYSLHTFDEKKRHDDEEQGKLHIKKLEKL